MSVATAVVDLDKTLHERFALERFRPGQREVIQNVLNRRDVLCVMPTGGGKSLCYQLPAVLLNGLTLVVSPLIALMKDQVDALTSQGIRATLINSTLDPAEQRLRLNEIEMGRYELVYVAPERFRSHRFVEAMARVKPALLAVDEAHCISEWGHDFRPDYARLGQARRALGMPPCIALTATATDLVRRDIADQLDLRDPAQFVTGFDRPNLYYEVIGARRDADKLAALAEVLDRNSGSAIIYASSRKKCEEVGRFLETDLRRAAAVYHAGLTREERTFAQDRFMSGEAEVVVATNAFGMGVDKPNIRSVIHFNMPGTLEAYYQEAGRAGRDGMPAECVLLYAPGDRFLQEMFIENEYPPPEAVFRVYEFLRGLDFDPIELTQLEIRDAAQLQVNDSAVGTALKLLEGAGALERFRPRENMGIIRINAEPDEPSFVDRLSSQAHIQRTVLLGLEGLVNRRFGEPVYFHPDEFASALGLDRPTLLRAIKHLTSELPIDYVPPFRGNAVRILDRSRRACELTIDFASLQKRKNQEYDKLERMIKYAQTGTCRRAFLLSYFGDRDAAECGHCDNCGNEPRVEGGRVCPIDTDAGREILLKLLSGVARSKGRFGKTVVAQMLTGSNSEKVVRWGLSRLSTFGILASLFSKSDVIRLLDALAAAGLLENQDVDRFRPVINLTARGWEVLRGTPHEVVLNLPEDLGAKVRNGGLERIVPRIGPSPSPLPAKSRTPATLESFDEALGLGGVEPGPLDPLPALSASAAASTPEPVASDLASNPLWERLRTLRGEWARAAGQPAYCIFTNQTLEALVRERPRSPRDLTAIKGLGPARIERYGAAILKAVGSAPGASSSPPPSPVEPPKTSPPLPAPTVEPKPNRYVPSEEWTWRLLDRGFRLDEAAAIRGLERTAVIRHATWMARQGRAVPMTSFLDDETLGRWDAWRRDHGDAPPDDALAAELWGLFLACRKAGEP
jgi:ATP-dependent DNA helicase RecQ